MATRPSDDALTSPATAPSDELRALSEAATPGPWVDDNPEVWRHPIIVQDYDGCDEGHRFVIAESHGMRQSANAAFIAAAVNHIRAALAAQPSEGEGR